MRFALFGLFLCGCSAAPVVPISASAVPRGGLEVEPVTGLGLFADERARSQTILAGGIDAGIIAPEVTQRAWALAAEGKNPLTGAACGRALGSWQARQRWGPALGITGSVSAHVWCEVDAGCELKVNGRPLDDDGADRFQLVAPFPAGDPLTALAATVPRLAPPVPDGNGVLGGLLGNLGGRTPIQDEDRLEVRVRRADQREPLELDEAQRRAGFPSLGVAQVLACLPPNDSRLELLVEVSPAGAITRCEGSASEEIEEARCGCGQLLRAQPAPWLAGRRWNVNLSVARRDQTTSDRRFVLTGWWNTHLKRVQQPGEKFARFNPKVEDPSIAAWTTGPSRLAVGCFVNAFTAAGGLSSRWAVWFDGAGRPTKVLEQKGFAPLQKDLADCVARALATAQAPCPSRAGLWAMADLRVTARDPNAPPPPLKDVLSGP